MERVSDHYLTTLSNVRAGPKWSFGGRPRPTSASATPGPGAYEPSNRPSSPSAPSYGFGSETRGKAVAYRSPGPGAYDPNKQYARNAPQWSMPGRKPPAKLDAFPGPGAYEIKLQSGAPAYGLGTGQRKTVSAPNTPGPGAYNPSYLGESAPQWGMGTGSRAGGAGAMKANVPGPGSYTLPTKLQEGPQYSMGGRSETRKRDSSPGPGAYNPARPEKDSGKYSFGIKTPALRLGAMTTPGPGTYRTEGVISSPKSPQWSFGSQKRGVNFVNSVPGPGQYNAEKSPRRQAPAWSLAGGGARGFCTKKDGPAPGTYNIPSHIGDGAKFSLGTQKRIEWNIPKQDTPGPCTYDPRRGDDSPQWGFGSSQRSPLARITATPGPGTYNTKDEPTGPQWTFNPRRENNAAGSPSG
ncbi:h-shippo 1 [Cystoisospora suis]|uniref:H-shippo 1 n=1 Tax=Cystoisospora suis TaxID=483139 RepID=A0A2C6L863_9APIC|nr:h-shippo 1 [Cystoisospora suis]